MHDSIAFPSQRFQSETHEPFLNIETSWGLAPHKDGLPVFGPVTPNQRTHELDNNLARVRIPIAIVANLSDAAQRQYYLQALERIVNGAAQLLHRQFWFVHTDLYVYLEFVIVGWQDMSVRAIK